LHNGSARVFSFWMKRTGPLTKRLDFGLDQPFWRRQASYVMDKPIPTFCAGVTVRNWVSGVDCPQTFRRGTREVIAAPDSEMTP
jgi:hypothetical protein